MKKKESLIHCKLEVMAGNQIIGSLVPSEFVSNSYFTTGIIAKFGQPRINENVFLKTGLLYARLENSGSWIDLTYLNSHFTDYYKVPLQIEYIIPKGNIKPRLGYGVNIYFPLLSTVYSRT